MQRHKGSRRTAVFSLNLGARWGGWSTSGPGHIPPGGKKNGTRCVLYSRRERRTEILILLGRVRAPNWPACSELLYRLQIEYIYIYIYIIVRYNTPFYEVIMIKNKSFVIATCFGFSYRPVFRLSPKNSYIQLAMLYIYILIYFNNM